MRAVLVGLCAIGASAACGAGRPRAPAATAPGGSSVTLYRDGALVQQQVELDVPAGGVAVARVRIPAGLGLGDVVALPHGGAAVTELRQVGAVKPAPPPPDRDQPAELELVVRARPGRAALQLGYVTDRLTWDVAYTLIATPARDRAALHGAIAIRNTTEIALPGARVRLVDATRADARERTAAALTSRVTGGEPGDPPPAPRELGRLDLAGGETRVELVRDAAPRPMRSVLVYDPIGPRYDRAGSPPAMDPDLGVRPPPGRRVEESFEIERDPAATAGLPAGPVRLLERRADGSLAQLGEARLFDQAARVAVRDTIAVGTAEGVSGERARRELTVDTLRQRVVEEIVITIDNRRPRPVEVVVREHLYRGTNWALAYISVPVSAEAKEGPQQVAPRITVPARSKGRIMYAVVYTW
ncbi:MAG TPA: hypothetical protein VK932_30865 [Kofleriaceae bacterium]|nr:hypothetical protein [Kofleriaceae bacterium]